MVTEELRTSGEGKSIYGYVTAPEGYKEKKLPTVIFHTDLVVMLELATE